MPQIREHILLARQVGVPALVVAINMIDMVDDMEIVKLIEGEEVKDVLPLYDFPADENPFVHISALKAKNGDEEALAGIWRLMTEVDRYVPTLVRDATGPS